MIVIYLIVFFTSIFITLQSNEKLVAVSCTNGWWSVKSSDLEI